VTSALVKPSRPQRLFQGVVAVQVEVPAELLVLLVADAVVDEQQAGPVFNQQAAHGPGAHVVGVGRVQLLPQALGHHAEHGATIKLKQTGVEGMDFHEIN
jgi:hypothetical protein